MLSWLRARSQAARTATDLYGSIVTAARREAFYSEHGIPDTPDGRFAMVAVHMYLVLERLQREGAPGQALARALVEQFVTDMDDCMREMGIGDLTVPRKVKKAAGAIYESAPEFRKAAAAGGQAALAEAVHQKLLSFAPRESANVVASYMQRAATALEAQPSSSLMAGHVAFPDIG